MKPARLLLTAVFAIAFSAAAHAVTSSGTVTDKTTGKPSAGDTVEMIDVQSNMAAVAKTATDAHGRYTISHAGDGPYLVRVTHQGAPYFIAAGGPSGDVAVYDVRSKVEGIAVEDQIFGMETQNDQLIVTEEFVVHNNSSPQVTLFNSKPFEFVLPEGATLDAAEATRPSGMPTMAMPKPLAEKGHYTFTVPIDPDQGTDKMTIFQVQFHVPYSGSFTFKPTVLLPVENFVVQMPKSMSFSAGNGEQFQSLQRDPAMQIFLLKNAAAGHSIAFTVSGTGSAPRDSQQADSSAQSAQSSPQNAGPGGGIGEPIDQPGPLDKYRWWILGGVALLLAAAAAFLLRKPAVAAGVPVQLPIQTAATAAPVTPAGKNAALLNALKEELFALESEKISGAIAPAEYDQQKAALETVLKRALQRNA